MCPIVVCHGQDFHIKLGDIILTIDRHRGFKVVVTQNCLLFPAVLHIFSAAHIFAILNHLGQNIQQGQLFRRQVGVADDLAGHAVGNIYRVWLSFKSQPLHGNALRCLEYGFICVSQNGFKAFPSRGICQILSTVDPVLRPLHAAAVHCDDGGAFLRLHRRLALIGVLDGGDAPRLHRPRGGLGSRSRAIPGIDSFRTLWYSKMRNGKTLRRFALGVNHRGGTLGVEHCVPCRAGLSFHFIKRVGLQHFFPVRHALNRDVVIPNFLFKYQRPSALGIRFLRKIHFVRRRKHLRDPCDVLGSDCSLPSRRLCQSVPVALHDMAHIVSVHHHAESADVQAGISPNTPHHMIRHLPKVRPVHVGLVGQSIFDKGNRIGKGGDDLVFLSAAEIDFFLIRPGCQAVFVDCRSGYRGGILRTLNSGFLCLCVCRAAVFGRPLGSHGTPAHPDVHRAADAAQGSPNGHVMERLAGIKGCIRVIGSPLQNRLKNIFHIFLAAFAQRRSRQFPGRGLSKL